jgi:hypothetical protein
VSSETKQLKDEKKNRTKKTPKDIKGLKSAQIVEIISQNEVARKTLPEATDANTNTVLQVPMTVPLHKKIETEKRPSERTELGKSKAKKVVKGKDDKKIEAKLNPEEIQSEETKSEPKKVEKTKPQRKRLQPLKPLGTKIGEVIIRETNLKDKHLDHMNPQEPKSEKNKIEPKSEKNKVEEIKPEINPVSESKYEEKKTETESEKSDEKIEEKNVPKNFKNTKSKTDVESNPKLDTVTPVGIKEKDIASSEQKIKGGKIDTKINSQPTKKIAKKFGKIGSKKDQMVPKPTTPTKTITTVGEKDDEKSNAKKNHPTSSTQKNPTNPKNFPKSLNTDKTNNTPK